MFKHFTVIVVALAMFSAVPVVAAENLIAIDAVALRENVIALDHEWIGSGPVTTDMKLAVGKQSVEDADMSLLGLAVGKRGYAYGVGHPSVGIYAGGYLFGQTIATSVKEMSEYNEETVTENAAPAFTERRTAVGLMSDIGLRFQAAKNFIIDVGPEVTIPFVIHRTNTDGQKETQRFPSMAVNWRLGLGYSW